MHQAGILMYSQFMMHGQKNIKLSRPILTTLSLKHTLQCQVHDKVAHYSTPHHRFNMCDVVIHTSPVYRKNLSSIPSDAQIPSDTQLPVHRLRRQQQQRVFKIFTSERQDVTI